MVENVKEAGCTPEGNQSYVTMDRHLNEKPNKAGNLNFWANGRHFGLRHWFSLKFMSFLPKHIVGVHPVCYTLLPNKQETREITSDAEATATQFDRSFISCDLEMAALRAMETVFPNAIVNGCFFDLLKNFRKLILGDNHLTARYNNEADFALAARMIPQPLCLFQKQRRIQNQKARDNDYNVRTTLFMVVDSSWLTSWYWVIPHENDNFQFHEVYMFLNNRIRKIWRRSDETKQVAWLNHALI